MKLLQLGRAIPLVVVLLAERAPGMRHLACILTGPGRH